ncbi:MAG: Cof-type HAD-IIB family hydrolase [Cypionkella sp.]
MRDTTPIRLVLADVDGTLVGKDKVLTDRALQAVRNLRAAGVQFAITTGRPPRGAAILIAPLQLDTPVAGFNGGVMVNPDLSVLETKLLDTASAKRAVTLIAEHGLDVWLYTADKWFVTAPKAPHVDREAWTVKFDPTVVADFADQLGTAVKIVGIGDDLEVVRKCEAAAQEALGTQVEAVRSQPYYLDVTHKDANKGAVVDALVRMLNVPASAIATIGDQPNDVLMFRKSGMSIAMGNASAEVKAQANHVTSSCEDEGFAKAIEDFVLSQNGA